MQHNKIYVGNLSYTTTETELKVAFSEFGEITDLKIITDRYSGDSKGFGFIADDNNVSTQKFIGFNGQDFQGKRLTVNIAKERERQSDGKQGGWNNRY